MPKIEDCIEYVDGDFIYAKDQLLKWNKKMATFSPAWAILMDIPKRLPSIQYMLFVTK